MISLDNLSLGHNLPEGPQPDVGFRPLCPGGRGSPWTAESVIASLPPLRRRYGTAFSISPSVPLVHSHPLTIDHMVTCDLFEEIDLETYVGIDSNAHFFDGGLIRMAFAEIKREMSAEAAPLRRVRCLRPHRRAYRVVTSLPGPFGGLGQGYHSCGLGPAYEPRYRG